jgi:hypothetical protein
VSSPNPVLVAAAPALINTIEALQTFVANMGTDPTQYAVKFPGALQVLIGSVELQLPVLAGSEIGALQSAANTKFAAWIAQLKALTPA